MSARRATQIEQAKSRVTTLEFARIAYAGYPAAAARIAAQLDEARVALAELQGAE